MIVGNFWEKYVNIKLLAILLACMLLHHSSFAQEKLKPRILISSDIGGTDPDDFQSMIHLLMYANEFNIEGFVSSPFGAGSKQNFIDIINLYSKDLPKLKQHSKGFPSAQSLIKLCKQGTKPEAPYKGYTKATEGSNWIVKCAKKRSSQPLWVLVWGGIEDIAQALYDAPEIKKNIRVYFIGGPNKKWSVNAYAYIAEHHPDLWMIEANATYRGWFMDAESPANLKADVYYKNFIKAFGAMGKDFINYYKGNLKMGDTPSLAYLLNGISDNPAGESWGGSFTKIKHSSRSIFTQGSTITDTVPTYSVVEWHFNGPKLIIPEDSVCFTLQVGSQKWPGYYQGNGIYAVRYSPKQVEVGSYITISNIPELNGLSGKYVSTAPWPGKFNKNDYQLGNNWYSDKIESQYFLDQQQGARTISKFRSEFLLDWAKRWEWLK